METKTAFKSQEGKEAVVKAYESILESWPAPSEKLYVNTRYGKTFMIASGDKEAPPLILLHGSAMNSIMWLGDAYQYSLKYRVYAVDLPGEPGKSDENQLPFEGDNFSEWLDDVYRALGLQIASLVGISLGAWLAVKYAVRYPKKVKKLVLLCPAGIGPQKKSFLLKAIVHMIQGEKGMDKLYKKVNGNQPVPEAMLNYQKLIGKNFNFRREIIPLFKDSELKRLTMQVILFVGEKDIMFHSDMTAKRLKDLVPQSNINIIPGASHALINLTDEICEFLEY